MKALFLKVVYYGLPTLALTAIVLSLLSGSVLKRPLNGDDDVVGRLDSVVALALSDRWEDAAAKAEDVHRAWAQVRGRIYLTSATDDMEIFDISLGELLGAIEGHDPVQVRISHRRLLALWEDLGS